MTQLGFGVLVNRLFGGNETGSALQAALGALAAFVLAISVWAGIVIFP